MPAVIEQTSQNLPIAPSLFVVAVVGFKMLPVWRRIL